MISAEERNRIRDWALAQKENMIRTLIDLVEVPSVSDPFCLDPVFGQPCQDALQKMLQLGRKEGLIGSEYDGYCGSLSIAGTEKQEPAGYTGIWSHLDVVPVDEAQWERPPFAAYYHDGLVTGRGAQDNKSGAVVGLYALKGLKELGITLKHPAALYFGISEECGMQDVQYFTKHYDSPGLSLIADCGFPACYGEKGLLILHLRGKEASAFTVQELNAGTVHNIIPDQVSVKAYYKGNIFSAEAAGKAGHAAVPANGVNALVGLLGKISEIADEGSAEKDILKTMLRICEDTTGTELGIAHQDAQLGDLTAVGTILSMEDECWDLTLDIRYPDSASAEEIISKAEAYADAHGLVLITESNMPAFGFSKDDPVITKLTQVYNREEADHASPYVLAGGTYAAIIPRAIPFGVSFSDKHLIRDHYPEGHGDYHQPDESVIVDQMVKALSIYVMALIEIDDIRQ